MRAGAPSASVESDDTLGPLPPHDLAGNEAGRHAPGMAAACGASRTRFMVPTFPDHALEFPEIAADGGAELVLARRPLRREIAGRLLGLHLDAGVGRDQPFRNRHPFAYLDPAGGERVIFHVRHRDEAVDP